MTRRVVLGMALAAALGLGGKTASADFVYGIDNSGHLHSVNTKNGQSQPLTTSPPGLSATANGLAFDKTNGVLYFQSPAVGGTLYKYALGSGASSATALTIGGTTPTIAGAAFANGAYWFINDGTNDLYKVDLTSASPTYEFVADLVLADHPGIPIGFTLGDIAITDDGKVYIASRNQGFYSADLTTLSGNKLGVTKIQAASAWDGNLQITLLTNGSLLGQSFSTGQWYDINTTTGARTLVSGLPTNIKFRDLAGSAPVPEPASVALMGVGVGAALVFGRRRLKSRA